MDTTASQWEPLAVPLPLEIRVHGRGGQGGVTCAKLLAAIYAKLGLHVQSFGDYGVERAGAPVRAFTRVDAAPVTNRNKVYAPDHLLVLDPKLMGDEVVEGAAPGAVLLLNTAQPLASFAGEHRRLRLATVDATAIAQRHGIGTSAVVIVNTTLAGAYLRVLGLPWEVLERVYAAHGLAEDLAAAREAYASVAVREPEEHGDAAAAPRPRPAKGAEVLDLTLHTADLPTPFETGSWRTQTPAYRAHAAPCSASCPAGNDVAGFLDALRTNGVDAAAEVLLRTQALPSVCGRVCPAPCMVACNRGAYDGAVNVRGLERWVGDHASPAAAPAREVAATPRKVAIVGGGPAGLGAAFALGRAGHDVTIVDAERELGGVLRTGIPSYRLPPEALDGDLARILALGVTVRCGAAAGPDAIAALASTHDAVIVATGLAAAGTLACPGAELPGVEQGLRFLAAARTGDTPPLDGHVVVVGGGNTAVDCARTALRCGASQVTLTYRRGRGEMPAIAEEIEEAVAEGVALLLLRQPVRFTGAGRVRAVELAEVELGPPDASGRRRPVVTGRTRAVPCDHVLLAVGQSADLGLLPVGWTVREGRAASAEGPRNVWLAGDLATSEGTVTHAVGHGRRVALRVLRALERGEDLPLAPGEGAEVTPAHVRFEYFAPEPPHGDRHLRAAERLGAAGEVNLGLSGPEEAERCFSCGRCTRCDTCLLSCPDGVIRRDGGGYAIDGRYCKGCGMCVAECPRRAMEMTGEGGVQA